MKTIVFVLTMFAGALSAQTNPQAQTATTPGKTQLHLAKANQPTNQARGTEKAPVYIKLIESTATKVEPAPKSEIGEGKNPTSGVDWNVISAIVSAIATVVVACFTVSLARSTKWLWEETKAAGNISRKSAEAAEKAAIATELSVRVAREAYIASERPWVSVDAVVGSDLLRKPHGIEFGVNFTVKNFGKSPAVNVHIFYEVVTLKLAQDQFSGVRQRINQMAIQGKAGKEMGIQLFPTEEEVIPWISSLSNDEIEDAKKSYAPPAGMLPSFFVIGSVFYQLPFDEEVHQTGFNYYVLSIGDPRYPKGSDVPEFGESFPMARIQLEPKPYYKGTIN
jgi:hypothetical protein